MKDIDFDTLNTIASLGFIAGWRIKDAIPERVSGPVAALALASAARRIGPACSYLGLACHPLKADTRLAEHWPAFLVTVWAAATRNPQFREAVLHLNEEEATAETNHTLPWGEIVAEAHAKFLKIHQTANELFN